MVIQEYVGDSLMGNELVGERRRWRRKRKQR